jgi:hypothetical protein
MNKKIITLVIKILELEEINNGNNKLKKELKKELKEILKNYR